jgi:hypothetical protein
MHLESKHTMLGHMDKPVPCYGKGLHIRMAALGGTHAKLGRIDNSVA